MSRAGHKMLLGSGSASVGGGGGGSVGPSGIPMPTGNVAGDGFTWEYIWGDDFNQWTCALGDFPGDGGSIVAPTGTPNSTFWNGYPDDTPAPGGQTAVYYYPSKTVSVNIPGATPNAIANCMNIYLHYDSDLGAYVVACPIPQMGLGLHSGEQGNLYMRTSACFRLDTSLNAGGNSVHMPWLMWPCSEDWPTDGELDFPEQDVNSEISGFWHVQGGTSGSDQIAANSTSYIVSDGQWHVVTMEWWPSGMNYIVTSPHYTSTPLYLGFTGGGAEPGPNGDIPNTAMNWRMQFQSNGSTPSSSLAGNVAVDWVVGWSYSA